MTQGKFISFEGGEGAGKSTQSRLLQRAFEKAGLKALHTREPGGTAGAEAIRTLLVRGEVNRWSPETETLLHFAARTDHVTKQIRPALTQGQYVICDRFIDSTFAYQSYGHGVAKEVVENINQLVLGGFKPDLTVVLDVNIHTGISRADMRGGDEDRYEKMGSEFHNRVCEGFRAIARAEPERCVLLDAADTIESIHTQIIQVINGRLGLKLATIC